jgi:hypothetical protein
MNNLTEREERIIRFAVWRFMNDAFSQAMFYSQKGRHSDAEAANSFAKDAKDAEELLAKLVIKT